MNKILLICLLLAGCASNEKVKIYGNVPSTSYIIAQICIKDQQAEINNLIKYAVLLKNHNTIRYFEGGIKNNGNYIFSAPIGEKSYVKQFLSPFSYSDPQYFGFMWNISTDKNWTQWSEPQYTIKDISDAEFKVDNGLIGKEIKTDNTSSAYLVRFKMMNLEDYITQHLNKWIKDPIPKCQTLP